MMLPPDLMFLLHVLCWGYHVEVPYAKAVMRMESGTKTQEYRLGRLGNSQYYGPFGVRKCFLKTRTPEEVICVGVKTLRGTAGSREKMVRRLKRYNEFWWKDNYVTDVMATYRKYKREKEE